MKVVLCGVGSTGDIQPLLALSRALAARRHDVVLCAGENYRPLAAQCGATFQSSGRSVEKMVKDAGDAIFNPLTFLRICRDIAPELLDLTIAACAGADVVVGGAACFVGPTAAHLTGARYAWAALAPGSFPTSTAPFLLSGVAGGPPWVNRASHAVGNGLMGKFVRMVLNPLRRQKQLPDVDSYGAYVLPHPALFAVDPLFWPLPADWQVTAHQTGFWHFDDDTPLPDDVRRFLDDGDPPVYVGFGSMPVKDRAGRTRAIVDGVVASGRRALIAAGWAGLGTSGALPSSVMSIGHVSHGQLFPRCALVAHHCGAGTSSVAARAGVPQLPVPHAWDQPVWRKRLLELGVANTALGRNFTKAALADGIARTLGDGDVRARATALGAQLRQKDGATEAAVVVEALAGA